jgi:hypothetical protein
MKPQHNGLRCPACKQAVAVIESQTPTALKLWCPACQRGVLKDLERRSTEEIRCRYVPRHNGKQLAREFVSPSTIINIIAGKVRSLSN